MRYLDRANDGYQVMHGLLCIIGLLFVAWLIWTAPENNPTQEPANIYEVEK